MWGYVYYGTKMSTLLTLYGCQKPNIDIPYMTRIQKNELIECINHIFFDSAECFKKLNSIIQI